MIAAAYGVYVYRRRAEEEEEDEEDEEEEPVRRRGFFGRRRVEEDDDEANDDNTLNVSNEPLSSAQDIDIGNILENMTLNNTSKDGE